MRNDDSRWSIVTLPARQERLQHNKHSENIGNGWYVDRMEFQHFRHKAEVTLQWGMDRAYIYKSALWYALGMFAIKRILIVYEED